MKKLLLSLILALTVLSPLSAFGVNTAKAASVPLNTAIRGTSMTTVYWYANDGKRYVFPNAATYYTWFPTFDNVRMIPDAELFSITIGGNVTYRPAAKLVKVNTDPKVYAVARGGVLRHVTSEYLAERLYGFDWRSDVHDIADVYFTNYTVGAPIYNESDFNVSNEYNGVSTPSDSLRGMTGTGATGEIVLNASRTNINPGEAVVLSVSNTLNYGSGYRIEIYDVRTNGLIRTCNLPVSTCDMTVYPQRNANENSVQYYAALRDSSSTTIKSGYSQVVYFGTTNGTQFSSGSSSLEANRTSANVGETVILTARAWNLNTNESNIRMELYRESNSSLVDTCYDRATCTFNVTVTNDGSNAVRYYVIVKNDANEQIPAAYSNRITVSGASNGTLALSASRSTVMSGETITLSATGGSAWNTSRIVLVNEQNGTTIANCYSVTNCTQSVTVTGYNGETIRYRAEARDWNGAILATAYVTVYVNSTGSQTGTITLSADRTSMNVGETANLSAYNPHLLSNTRWTIHSGPMSNNNGIYKWCSPATATCSYSFHPIVSGTYTFKAEEIDANGVTGDVSNLITITVAHTPAANGTLTLTSNSATTCYTRTGLECGYELTATYTGTMPYNGSLVIKSADTNAVVKTCYVSPCRVSMFPNKTSLQYVMLLDGNGNAIASQYGPVVIFLNSFSNDGVNYINGLVLNADRTSINSGELVRLTANAFNAGTWSYTGNRIEIWNVKTNQLLRTCYDVSTCTLDVYPQGTATDMTAQYQARIYDRNGVLAMSQYSAVIYISGTGSNPGNGSISGSGVTSYAPASDLRVNRNIYLTSTFTGSNLVMSDAKVEIYAEHLSTPVATCYGSYTCSVYYPTGSSPMTTRVYARLSNRYNVSQWLETPRVSMTTTW
ncbi:hypothetical protein IT087_01535 [Candidatus Uhrbacteria bacterium]|nr:hypothetical protein [Candidatus Uhrbacteria bacterium]